jgi:integrase
VIGILAKIDVFKLNPTAWPEIADDPPCDSRQRMHRIGPVCMIHSKAIFGAAVVWGFIKHNPFRVDRNSGSSPLRFKPKSRPWQEITASEFKRFLSVIPDARRRILYLLMYACGLRPGEVYNLTVANVDLKARRIHIRNRAATADVPPFTVKADHQSAAGKERFVPIPEALIPDLVAVMATALKSGGFLALTPERYQLMKQSWRLCRDGKGWAHHGPRPWQNRDMVNNCLRDAKHFFKKAGVELTAPLTLSSFRKSFAQGLAGCGVPPKTLAHLLGHSDTRITMEFYNRVTDENTRAAAETMNRLLAEEKESTPKRRQI